jgi:glycosyltransferase involved in cell wall biosynthesis
MMQANPRLTVVLIAGNNRERAQRMLRSILEQDIAEEIVIAVFDRADRPSRDLPELKRSNIIYEAADKSTTLGALRARATRAASTEIIAFIEEHVVVPAGWARESLRRHDEGYAAVSGTFTAGNPHHRWARIVFSITYGSYALPTEGGEAAEIPGANSSFVPTKLLNAGDDLELLLGSDILLIRRLRARGEKLYRAANLSLKHWNDVEFRDGWIALFYSSQIYICNLMTVEEWSPMRRALRFLAMPLVPFVRVFKNYKYAKRNDAGMKRFFVDVPAIFLFQVGSAAGMAAGLLFGHQNSERKFADCETTAKSWD